MDGSLDNMSVFHGPDCCQLVSWSVYQTRGIPTQGPNGTLMTDTGATAESRSKPSSPRRLTRHERRLTRHFVGGRRAKQKYTPIRPPRRAKRESAATPPPQRSRAPKNISAHEWRIQHKTRTQGRPTHNPQCNQLVTTASRITTTSVGGCRRQQTPGGSACFDGLHGDGVET
jgi:hypothetical protein